MTDQPTPPPEPTPAATTPPGTLPHHGRSARRGFHPLRVFFGMCVMFVGVALLARQFGWDWIDPRLVFKFWPILIILMGLSMLVRGGVVRTTVSVMVVVGIIVALIIGSAYRHRTTTSSSFAIQQQTTATSSHVRFDVGGATLDIDGSTTDVVSGTATSISGVVDVNSTLEGAKQVVTIQPRMMGMMWFDGFRNHLATHLSSTLPTELEIHSGAADVHLDARSIHATAIDIFSGAANIDLQVGSLVDRNNIHIQSGASAITITAPTELGVQVQIDAAASSKDISGLEKISDQTYESAGFATALKKAIISIQAGASDITFSRR